MAVKGSGVRFPYTSLWHHGVMVSHLIANQAYRNVVRVRITVMPLAILGLTLREIWLHLFSVPKSAGKASGRIKSEIIAIWLRTMRTKSNVQMICNLRLVKEKTLKPAYCVVGVFVCGLVQKPIRGMEEQKLDPYTIHQVFYAGIAQLVEQRICNP